MVESLVQEKIAEMVRRIVERQRDVIGTIVHPALTEGKVLYAES